MDDYSDYSMLPQIVVVYNQPYQAENRDLMFVLWILWGSNDY
jgi:hypothetical protein